MAESRVSMQQIQQVVDQIAEAQRISDAVGIAQIQESLVASTRASAGPSADTLSNLVGIRLSQVWVTKDFREVSDGGAWPTGNAAKFRFCVREDRTFDTDAIQESNPILIRAMGFFYNSDIPQDQLELLMQSMAKVNLKGVSGYTELHVPVSELLSPVALQTSMRFDPANANGELIPAPNRVVSQMPGWEPPEALYVKESGYVDVELYDFPSTTPADDEINIKPFFVYDNYLAG